MTHTDSAAGSSARFAELFTPKLLTVLREGYGLSHFKSDLIAGLTVAVVALPLSMAIAIAAGATPAQGLYTAIFGGLFVSALGGSRFQIGGPAGAFIVLMATTVATHGMDGLLLATMMAGVLLLLIGLLRLGTYIKFIPYPVTVGFTAGIAIIIFASQLKELLGLTLSGPEPGPLLEKLPVLAAAFSSWNAGAAAISVATILLIVGLKRFRPAWPGMLLAVSLAALATAVFDLPVDTIGSRFGGIPAQISMPHLPALSWEKAVAVLPSAIAFALLGAIESLLSAVVADGMTGRRHRSNCELAAQGIANIISPLFGGICVTGTIARTATNIRAGAHGPVAGIVHAVCLLLFIVIAAPVAYFIPLAALAGVLAVVAWNMIEKSAIVSLLRASRGDALVLGSVFLLTIFRDLTEAIVVGVALGSVLFISRMARATSVEMCPSFAQDDLPDSVEARSAYNGLNVASSDIVVYRITGAFFFGAASAVGAALDAIADDRKALILDFTGVPFIDSTAAKTLEGTAEKHNRHGIKVIVAGASRDVMQALFAQGLKPPVVSFERSVETALAKCKG
ncbi:SulP family inorganic anion transporter [Pseudovibrio exalbescens]|uniref:SulP family inorganic anion transporter n=1 Tax=Pseudovibrio exalbescens TaxID=197461 RepID=UPI00236736D6|nr:SulP family inorganic anion transporter [Pseudovibrio exalbescens]MDD7911418.1 SulP family inorganic anion transporter [Pseudovibrio exalbescens]